MKKLKTKKVKFGELEDLVMDCVWELCDCADNGYVDVKSIMQSLVSKKPDKQYVYTTIHTTCLRLCKKKRLEKVQVKNKYFYKSLESKDMAFKKEILQLGKKYFNGDLQVIRSSIDKILT